VKVLCVGETLFLAGVFSAGVVGVRRDRDHVAGRQVDYNTGHNGLSVIVL